MPKFLTVSALMTMTLCKQGQVRWGLDLFQPPSPLLPYKGYLWVFQWYFLSFVCSLSASVFESIPFFNDSWMNMTVNLTFLPLMKVLF